MKQRSGGSPQQSGRHEQRLRLRWYVAISFAISLCCGLLLQPIVSEEYLGFLTLGMGFVLTYGIHQRIERGQSDVRGGASIVLGIVVTLSVANAPFVPLYAFWMATDMGWVGALREILVFYALVVAFVIVLTTTLSWTTNRGPIEVLMDALRRIGVLD